MNMALRGSVIFSRSYLKLTNRCIHVLTVNNSATTKTTNEAGSGGNDQKMLITLNVENKGAPFLKQKTKAEKLSRAMIAFLERKQEYQTTIQAKEEEYELGRRHLARMMGHSQDGVLSEKDVAKAINYLLPSALHEKRARPFMKRPQEYYPRIKELSFDEEGRPFHYLFYTGSPKYYELIDTICSKLRKLDQIFDDYKKTGLIPEVHKKEESNKSDEESPKNELELLKFDKTNSNWINEPNLAELVAERVSSDDYTRFVGVIERLANHPFSNIEKDFIMKYRVVITNTLDEFERNLLTDENGRKYAQFESKQRTARVFVQLKEGNGNVLIESPDGKFDILFFQELKHREQLLFPFKIVGLINKFDLFIKCNDSGMSVLSKATRFAISKALCNFLSLEDIEKLRIAGLLSRDAREKERKKYGQEGARRKYTWKKR